MPKGKCKRLKLSNSTAADALQPCTGLVGPCDMHLWYTLPSAKLEMEVPEKRSRGSSYKAATSIVISQEGTWNKSGAMEATLLTPGKVFEEG